MRAIKHAAAASAIAATSAGLMAAPAVAAGGHAGAQTREAFHCNNVTNNSGQSSDCQGDSVNVGPGDTLRVAVRDSNGNAVHFHAYHGGNVAGSWSHYRKAGQSSVFVWKNKYSKTLKMHLRAQIRSGDDSSTVKATAYVS